MAAVSWMSPWTMVRSAETVESGTPLSESMVLSLVGLRATDWDFSKHRCNLKHEFVVEPGSVIEA